MLALGCSAGLWEALVGFGEVWGGGGGSRRLWGDVWWVLVGSDGVWCLGALGGSGRLKIQSLLLLEPGIAWAPESLQLQNV